MKEYKTPEIEVIEIESELVTDTSSIWDVTDLA